MFGDWFFYLFIIVGFLTIGLLLVDFHARAYGHVHQDGTIHWAALLPSSVRKWRAHCDCNEKIMRGDGAGDCRGMKESPDGTGIYVRKRDFCTSQTTEEGCNRSPPHDIGTCVWK